MVSNDCYVYHVLTGLIHFFVVDGVCLSDLAVLEKWEAGRGFDSFSAGTSDLKHTIVESRTLEHASRVKYWRLAAVWMDVVVLRGRSACGVSVGSFRLLV